MVSVGQTMTELMKFREWAEKIGHYRVVEAVDRYLAMLETEEFKDKEVEVTG
jgi:hypothetical protein